MINNPVAIESLGIDPMKTFEEISPVDHWIKCPCSIRARENLLEYIHTFLNTSIFTVNYFYYVINCLNINHVTIYTTKCLGIVTWKKQYSQIENKTKQNRYEFPCASSIIKCLENFKKMPSFDKFFSVHLSSKAYTFISNITKCLSYLIAWRSAGNHKWKVDLYCKYFK